MFKKGAVRRLFYMRKRCTSILVVVNGKVTNIEAANNTFYTAQHNKEKA